MPRVRTFNIIYVHNFIKIDFFNLFLQMVRYQRISLSLYSYIIYMNKKILKLFILRSNQKQ